MKAVQFGCITLICCVLLTACASSSSSSSTARASEQQTPTTTACPTVARPASSKPEVEPTKLTIVLVDKSGSYAESTAAALDHLRRVLPKTVAPGDQVLVGWVGSNSGDPAEFFLWAEVQGVSPTSLAEAPLKPTPGATPTLISLPDQEPNTAIGRSIATQTAVAIATANAYGATQVAEAHAVAVNIYRCEQLSWQAQYEREIQAWEGAKREAIEEFTEYSTTQLDAAATIPAIDQTTRITDALLVASKIFQDAIAEQQYERYQLLIFSDMQEVPSDDAVDTTLLDLHGVDVTIAGLTCEHPRDCHIAEQKWGGRFSTAGAKTTRFLLVLQTTDDALVKAMR